MQTTQPTVGNDELHRILVEATGLEPAWTRDARANPFGWLRLDRPDKLKDAARALAGKARLCTITAYAEERDDPGLRRRIAYHFASGDALVTVTVPLYDPDTMEKLAVPSITPWFLNADWNEREFMEMFDIAITEHPNPKRLFLDERLDAGIMSKLIPFSAMAHGAASNTLWERILEAKGVPLEDRMPSLTVPAEPIKVEPRVTPVAKTEPALEQAQSPATLATVAASARVANEAAEQIASGSEPADLPLQKGEPSSRETAPSEGVAKTGDEAPAARKAAAGSGKQPAGASGKKSSRKQTPL